MVTEPITRRTLNRTLLSRQLLLEQAGKDPLDAIAHLLGLQSQVPTSPYPGLWSRLAGFDFDALGTLLTQRRVVRMVLMRGTVHLVTARDARLLRPWLQTAMDRAVGSSRWAAGTAGADREAVVARTREALREAALSPAQLRAVLGARFPHADPESLVNMVRVWAPLVQVPPRGVWGASGGPRYAFADDWLAAAPDSPPGTAEDPGGAAAPDAESAPARVADPDAELVRRYLAAFGPASPADMQKWSGRTGLTRAFAALDLRTYTTEDGRLLHDLPDAPLADPGTEVAARYVADFDNLVLSHADRTRILGDVPKERVITVNGLVRGTILIDGFVGGTWRFDRAKGAAALVVAPFVPLGRADRATLTAEGERLLNASDPGAPVRAVRFEEA